MQANLDDNQWPPRHVQHFISRNKDEGLRPQHLGVGRDLYQHQMISLYDSYEVACQRAGVVDFAELLLRAHELWRDRSDILQHYRQCFGAILVDEFQDTNAIQYAWLRLLENRQDNPAFERAVNQPPRGIGARTLETVREHARIHSLSLWQAAQAVIRDQQLAACAAGALTRFLQLIDDTQGQLVELTLSEQADRQRLLEQGSAFSLRQQCALLGINRSSVYYLLTQGERCENFNTDQGT